MRDEARPGLHADPRAKCDGKERFSSWGMAAAVGKRRRRREKKCCAYRCTWCGGYHLGDLVGKRRRRHQVPQEIEA